MKDSLTEHFRARFQGHEAPVDPATWQVIEARLIAAGPASDPVNDLFRERFHGHEAEVDPAVWDGISAQLGHKVAAGSAAAGAWSWWAAGIVGVAAAGALAVLLTVGPDAPQEPAVAAARPPVAEAPAPEAAEADAVQVPAPAVTVAAPAAPARRAAVTSSAIAQREAAAVKSAPEPEPQMPEAPLAEAPQQAPEVVERIITTLTEQVKQEAAQQQAKPRRARQTDRGDQDAVSDHAQPRRPDEDPAPLQKLFLPNTFTPNNDGINDTYVVPMEGLTSVMMRVYAIKTNQLVFATNSGEPWTGANCEDGMYLVAVEAMTTDGRMLAEGKVVYLNRSGTN